MTKKLLEPPPAVKGGVLEGARGLTSVQTFTQIAVPIAQGVSELAGLLTLFSEGGVSVLAVSTDRESGSPYAFVLVDSEKAARRVIEAADKEMVCSRVLLLKPEDFACGVREAVSCLREHGVAVRRLYGVGAGAVIEADEPERALALLTSLARSSSASGR